MGYENGMVRYDKLRMQELKGNSRSKVGYDVKDLLML